MIGIKPFDILSLGGWDIKDFDDLLLAWELRSSTGTASLIGPFACGPNFPWPTSHWGLAGPISNMNKQY
jgi:hypothetical protein